MEISPTKKYFRKRSKSLKTMKEPKQNINPDKPEGIKSIAKLRQKVSMHEYLNHIALKKKKIIFVNIVVAVRNCHP